MRVREHLDAMPSDDQQRLLNQLTIGCGWVLRAAQLGLRDAPCGRILDALRAAQAPLAGVVGQLDGRAATPLPERGAPAGARTGLRALGWQDFLATQRPMEATVLGTDLAALAHQTRDLVRVVQDDADTAHLTRHLHATIVALTVLRERLAGAVEP